MRRPSTEGSSATETDSSGTVDDPRHGGQRKKRKPCCGRTSKCSSCCSWKGFVQMVSQQNLRSWKLSLTPTLVVALCSFIGVVFILFGFFLLRAAESVVECEVPYPDTCTDDTHSSCPEQTTVVGMTKAVCKGSISENQVLEPPTFLYYQLDDFHQNNLIYFSSRSDAQLAGKVLFDASQVEDCKPVIFSGNSSRILSPCGLAATSVFNDTYTLSDGDGKEVTLDESLETLTSEADAKLFVNPNPADPNIGWIDEWLDETIFPGKVTNPHFILWMNIASMPTFRKLYARIDVPVKLPITVNIRNRYPGAAMSRKTVVLETTSWLGGRNSIGGILYLIVGVISLLVALWFGVRMWRKPWLTGDVRYINWTEDPHRIL